MPDLDIHTIISSAGLLMPLAGIGRSRDVARGASPAAQPEAPLPVSRAGLSIRWRMDRAGVLIMEWTT